MKEIKFRPLKRIKKTGKIVVSSYMQWNKVMTADYSKFNLITDEKHKKFPQDEYVYNHKGELLFFFDINPANVPVFQWSKLNEVFDLDYIRENNKHYGILWSNDGHVNYRMRGTDCNGVPTFSHFTKQEIVNNYENITEFEPLTVKTVCFWYGWFLYKLNNARLIKHEA